MRFWIWLALASGALWVAGCVRDQGKAGAYKNFPDASLATSTNRPGPDLIVTALEGLNGKVSSVDLNLRFVVLTFPVGQMPALNQQLNLYRGGLKVGIVNVCGPQNDDSIVADILMGEAQTGDQVRDR